MIFEFDIDDLAFVAITITPAPMSVSPVAASRIYPLTVHLFCAARLTAKMTAIAANVNFRIKEYLFEDSLASNPFHYNQSTLSPSAIHTKMQLTQILLHFYTYFPVLLFKTANIYIYIGTTKIKSSEKPGVKIFPVSKNAQFTHNMTKFRPMVSRKRFSAHGTWKTRRSIMQRNQNPHDAEHPKTLNSPPLSRKNCFPYHLKRFPRT